MKKGVLRARTTKVGSSGVTTIRLVPTKALKRKLRAKARARDKKVVATRVRVKVGYRPAGGALRVKTRSYVLQLRAPRA